MNLSNKIVGILQVLLTYYLSAKYICFGIPKMLQMQFNILRHEAYTPLAELSKLDHMWSFFGRSYNYSLFLGLIELVIGILVVFKKTRLIALLMLLAVSTNILILNIEFDVDFAIGHVAFDLIVCLLLLIPYLPDLREFFLKLGGKMKLGPEQNRSKLARSIPVLFVSILTVGYSIFSVYIKNLYTPPVQGTYVIEKIEINGFAEEISKGKMGKLPMFFVEYNGTVALSLNDSLTFGSISTVNDTMVTSFRTPLFEDVVFGRFEDNEVIGTRSVNGSSTNEESIRITLQRMDEKDNYLNGL